MNDTACLCCDGVLPDPRNFRPADVCDRCLGYLLARIPEHPHDGARGGNLWCDQPDCSVHSPHSHGETTVCDPEHREDVE